MSQEAAVISQVKHDGGLIQCGGCKDGWKQLVLGIYSLYYEKFQMCTEVTVMVW